MPETGTLFELLRAYAPAGTVPVCVTSSADDAMRCATGAARALTGRRQIVTLAGVAALRQQIHDDVAACVAEPAIRTTAGHAAVPPGELREVRAMCDEAHVLLVDDERFAGGGRTGFLWGITRDGVTPDLAVAGDTLTRSRHPLGVVFARPEIAAHVPSEGEPSAEATREAIALLEDLNAGNALGEVRRKAANLTDMLAPLQAHPAVAAIHQRGMIAAVHVRDEATAAVVAEAVGGDAAGTAVVLTPRLDATDADLAALVKDLTAALGAIRSS